MFSWWKECGQIIQPQSKQGLTKKKKVIDRDYSNMAHENGDVFFIHIKYLQYMFTYSTYWCYTTAQYYRDNNVRSKMAWLPHILTYNTTRTIHKRKQRILQLVMSKASQEMASCAMLAGYGLLA